jgi:hypothetical protein
MTRFSILLASALAVTLGGQDAMAKDPSLAPDVQEMFGPTVSGAGPVTLIGTISRSMSGQAEDLGPVTMIETISRSELVKMVSTFPSEEIKWSPSPFAAQARQIEDSLERRWDHERSQ